MSAPTNMAEDAGVDPLRELSQVLPDFLGASSRELSYTLSLLTQSSKDTTLPL